VIAVRTSIDDESDRARRDVLVFSKYFGYNLGGAERSMFEFLRAQERAGRSVRAVMVQGLQSYDAQRHRMELPTQWALEPLRFSWDAVRFRYLAYAVNRSAIVAHFRAHEPGSELYAYGHYAPAAIVAYRGPSVYILRDEYGLGWEVNYESGWNRVRRTVYHMLESPWKPLWMRDLRAALRRARIIANSKFMAAQVKVLDPDARVEVLYPQIDCEMLRAQYAAAAVGALERGVVMAGNSLLKGTDVFLRVAAAMPAYTFYVFDRAWSAPQRRGNVVFMPWQSEPGAMYAYANVVMVPSRWAEAYGRTVVEAQCLGIPVIASNRGGIPEAIEDPSRLVDDLDDIDAWRSKLLPLL